MKNKILTAVLACTLIVPLIAAGSVVAAPYTPTLPDCSQQAKLPATWGQDVINQVKAKNPAANPTNQWAITYNFSSATASSSYMLVFWASPINTRTVGSRSMWYTHNATDPKKIEFNIDSTKGDVYRIAAIVGPDGIAQVSSATGTWYDVPWAKTVNVPVTCATLNHRTPVTDTTSGIVWDLSQTAMTVQDVNLGFFDPPAADGGTTGGTVDLTGLLTTASAVDLGIKGLAVLLTGFIAFIIIKQFRFITHD